MNAELEDVAKRLCKLMHPRAVKDPLWEEFGIKFITRADPRPGRSGIVVEAIVGPAHVVAIKEGEVAKLVGIIVETPSRGMVEITDYWSIWDKFIAHIRKAMSAIEEVRRAEAIIAMAGVEDAIQRCGKAAEVPNGPT